MNYERLETTLQQHFRSMLPLMPAQIRRLSLLCRVILLADRIHLTFLARRLPRAGQQDSRVRWIRRLFTAPFMQPEWVYQPLLKPMLRRLKLPCWHLVIDRTPWMVGCCDVVTISLSYHRRAIPLIWQQVPYGGAPLATYIALVQQVAAWIPIDVPVIFHGDTEFGGGPMIRCLRRLGWDFILGQRQTTCFRRQDDPCTQPLASLVIPQRRTIQLANVDLFVKNPIPIVNLIAFQQRRYDRKGQLTRETCYLATSLPLTRPIKRLGRRRWGIEPFHKDYKSSGWQIHLSQLKRADERDGLLLVLALCYLLSVCLGRWLCKCGRRRLIDNHPQRHFSLFRLGWDLIVYLASCQQAIPFRLTLYP